MLSLRHRQQVKELIGTKVKVYLSLEKYIRELKEDKDGLYVEFKGERVPVHPDTKHLNVFYFTGLEPKNRKVIVDYY